MLYPVRCPLRKLTAWLVVDGRRLWQVIALVVVVVGFAIMLVTGRFASSAERRHRRRQECRWYWIVLLEMIQVELRLSPIVLSIDKVERRWWQW